MDNPRAEKVAVVDEVKERLSAADATVLADYRGIDVPGMAELRRALRSAGGDVKIYKNTLVRFAAQQLDLDIEDMLIGPTALAFAGKGEDGRGDPVLVAKALRDFARGNDNLEIKGGLLGDRLLTAAEVDHLAKVAPREELLARFAAGLAAPMRQLAGLLQALPRDFAYGLAALIDEKGGPEAAVEGEADDAEADDEPTAQAVVEGEADDAPADDEPTADADGDPAADEPTAQADDADGDPAADESAEDTAPAEDSDESATQDSATDDSDSEEG